MTTLESMNMPRTKIASDSLLGIATLRAIEPVVQSGKKPDWRDWLRATKAAADAVQLPVLLAIAHENKAGGGDRADGWPSQKEYAAWWKLSERSMQREWALYRRVFGAEADPYEAAKAIYANYTSRIRAQDVSVVYDVPAALVAAA